MDIEVVLLDGTVVRPKFDFDNHQEVVSFYQKQAQRGKIKSFKASYSSRVESLEDNEEEDNL